MTTHHVLTPSTSTVPATGTFSTPGRGRRTALVVTGFLACALPTLWFLNITRMLVTGVDTDHRFHQLTGQGLLLCLLWLVPMAAMLRAGWRGDRPAASWGWAHLTFVLTGAACAAAATGGGAPALAGVVAVTGGLLWTALPRRPHLRGEVRLDPLLTPAALATTAFYVPYAVDQLRRQNAVTSGMHVDNPHFFDMAWLVGVFMVLAVLAAILPAGRRLVAVPGLGSVAVGVAGLATGEGTAWSLGALAVGAALLVAGSVRRAHRPA